MASEQPIIAIRVPNGDDTLLFDVGKRGITRIEAYEEPGEYCMIPYVRVWLGEEKIAEYVKHCLHGVYYGAAEQVSA